MDAADLFSLVDGPLQFSLTSSNQRGESVQLEHIFDLLFIEELNGASCFTILLLSNIVAFLELFVFQLMLLVTFGDNGYGTVSLTLQNC